MGWEPYKQTNTDTKKENFSFLLFFKKKKRLKLSCKYVGYILGKNLPVMNHEIKISVTTVYTLFILPEILFLFFSFVFFIKQFHYSCTKV